MKMRIHVNMHIIRANKKNDTRDPVITCKTSKSNTYAYSVDIDGPSKVIYSPCHVEQDYGLNVIRMM